MAFPRLQHFSASVLGRVLLACLLLCGLLALAGCFGEKELEPFYGRAVKPDVKEFRWCAGPVPKVFDPALATTAPDLDATRALYEGLTDYDAPTLTPVPAIAQRWEVAEDSLTWTFYLRRNATWSNGETVTAQDFVRSWQRVLALGEKAPQGRLFGNLLAVYTPTEAVTLPVNETEPESSPTPAASPVPSLTPTPAASGTPTATPVPGPTPEPLRLRVKALSEYVLQVRLQEPMPELPALLAHPVFRPVHKDFTPENTKLISNGPFQLAVSEKGQVVLERAPEYWDAANVGLQRVRFVAAPDAEAALALYRAGEVDAVTNAAFEPLALKLLAPYQDFRRVPFSALTYYQFNPLHPPFDNVKVRQALALALDRERLAQDELGGAKVPAVRFLLAGADKKPDASTLEHNAARARDLLQEAGYPGGANFPTMRLLVNRNEQQKRVARAIAAIWQRDLGVKTDIVLKSWNDYQAALVAGDYDLARRSTVLPTTETITNLRLLFAPVVVDEKTTRVATPSPTPLATPETVALATPAPQPAPVDNNTPPASQPTPFPIPADENEALRDLPAMPVYFASSYTLVKPYISGFDANVLDAPSLKRVRLNPNWQPPNAGPSNWFKTSSFE